jgi:hypothetical protein
MQDQHIYSQIRAKIGQDKLDQALQDMKQLLSDSPKLDEVIQQSSRFKDIQKQIHLGTVSHENATLTKNQIRSGLLALLREMQTGESEPAIQKAANEPQTIQNAEKIYNIQHIDQANFS